MLRNWLILVSDEDRSQKIAEKSTYKAVETIKDLRVSLLSGEFSGVVVLSILDSDANGLPGFISSLKNHPDLKKVQVILSNELKSGFSDEQSSGVKFFTIEQISTLIDINFGESSSATVATVSDDNIDKGISYNHDSINHGDVLNEQQNNLDFLKHTCAKAISQIIIDGKIETDREELIELFCRKLRDVVL